MRVRGVRLLKYSIIAVAAFDLFLICGVLWGSYGAYAAAVLSPSKCPLPLTLRSVAESERLARRTDHHASQMTTIAREKGLELRQTAAGRFWVPAGDRILPFLIAEQDLEIYGQGSRGVHSGDIVLDCGANIGMFTRTALKAGARLVVAIEPAPDTLECLRRNLAADIRAGRVIVYPKGVWDHDDWLRLALDDSNSGSNSLVLGANRPSVRVPLTTIDKLVTELKLERVDFIKMDIEGAEKNALSGARDTLRTFRPRMSISSEHLPDDTEKIPILVKSLVPSYRWECGPCVYDGAHARPEALYFF